LARLSQNQIKSEAVVADDSDLSVFDDDESQNEADED
jgi:hypothetical protein